MSIESIDKATRIKGAERDVIEVIARMLELPEPAVARVISAWACAQEGSRRWQGSDFLEVPSAGEELDAAIKVATVAGMRRVVVRRHVEEGLPMKASFTRLVPASSPDKMCDGCVHRLECVRDRVSTPQKCLDGKRSYFVEQHDGKPNRFVQFTSAVVTPIKIHGDQVTVTAKHPAGTYVLRTEDLVP